MTYIRHRTELEPVERVQDRIEEAFQSIDSNFIAGAVLIQDVELLAAESTIVNHGLGYVYRGFIVVRLSQAATVTDVAISASVARRQIVLDTTADTVVSLLVF